MKTRLVSEEKGDFFSNASRNSHHTYYKEVSSESSKEDSKSHDEEGDSSEEEGVTMSSFIMGVGLD